MISKPIASTAASSRSASDYRLKTIVDTFDAFWERNLLLTPLVPKKDLPTSFMITTGSPFPIDYDTRTQPCSLCFVRKPVDQMFPGFLFQFIPDISKDSKLQHNAVAYTLLEHAMMPCLPYLPHPNIDLGCMCSISCAATVLAAVQSFLWGRYQNQLLMPVLSAAEYEKILTEDLVSMETRTALKPKPKPLEVKKIVTEDLVKKDSKKKEQLLVVLAKKPLMPALEVKKSLNVILRNEQIKEELKQKKRPRGGRKVRAARARKMMMMAR